MREIVATRRALYELACEIPIWRLAPLFGESDVALGNTYRTHWINRRSRGDWARIQHGQRFPRPPFRAARPGTSEVVRFGADASDRRRDRGLIAVLALDAAAPPPTIPVDLLNAHPLVRRGAKVSARLPYLGEENLPSAAVDAVMDVPKSQDSRARRFMSGLFYSLEDRGVGIQLHWTPSVPQVRLDLLGVRFGLQLTFPRRRSHLAHRVSTRADDDHDFRLDVDPVDGPRGRRFSGTATTAIECRIAEIAASVIALAAAIRERGGGPPMPGR